MGGHHIPLHRALLHVIPRNVYLRAECCQRARQGLLDGGVGDVNGVRVNRSLGDREGRRGVEEAALACRSGGGRSLRPNILRRSHNSLPLLMLLVRSLRPRALPFFLFPVPQRASHFRDVRLLLRSLGGGCHRSHRGSGRSNRDWEASHIDLDEAKVPSGVAHSRVGGGLSFGALCRRA